MAWVFSSWVLRDETIDNAESASITEDTSAVSTTTDTLLCKTSAKPPSVA